MILAIFQNFCILITGVVFVMHYLREKNLHEIRSTWFRFFMGVIAGGIAMVLLGSSFLVDPLRQIVLDFRYVPVFVISIYGGWISTLVATLIIATYRWVINDISAVSTAMALATVWIGLSYSVIFSLRKPLLLRVSLAMLVHTIIMYFASYAIFDTSTLRLQTLIIHLFITFAASYIVWKYVEFALGEIRVYQRFRSEATTDYLTSLSNRRKFSHELNAAIHRCQRKNETISLLYLDIDRFKAINDEFGHAIGDDVLRKFAGVLLKTCRIYDGLYRIGGEEFAVILQDCPIENAWIVAERIRQNILDFEYSLTGEANVTTSIGVAGYVMGISAEEMMGKADDALYQAKNAGRNCVYVASMEKKSTTVQTKDDDFAIHTL
ncbi:MAG: GGDEF domain-containing protein [Erysipelotrichaceae bacterium]